MTHESMRRSAEDLRREFDESFHRRAQMVDEDQRRFLLVEAGGEAVAIPVASVAGLFVDHRITPLPASETEQLGLAAVRGMVVPVFDLALVLGLRPSGRRCRWLVLASSTSAFGLAVDSFRGQLRTQAAMVTESPAGPAALAHCDHLVRTEELAFPVISMTAIADRLSRAWQDARSRRGTDDGA